MRLYLVEEAEQASDTSSPPHTTRDLKEAGLHLYSTSTYFLHIELIIINHFHLKESQLT